MTAVPKNFEPYFDWSAITEEQAVELAELISERRDAIQALIDDPSSETASRAMEVEEELEDFFTELKSGLYRVPAMVHVADHKKTETNPDDETQHADIQRCARCKSILSFWHPNMITMGPQGPHRADEDEVDWWTPGSLVAKATDDGGFLPSTTMYLVEDRELYSHERECVDMPDMSEFNFDDLGEEE